MDLRGYYKKIRDVESALIESYPIVVSLETADGGRSGISSEVPRLVAAKQIVEGRARLATQAEAALFHEHNLKARRAAEQIAALNRMQLMVVPAKAQTTKGARD